MTAGTTGAEGVDRETLSKALPRLRGAVTECTVGRWICFDLDCEGSGQVA